VAVRNVWSVLLTNLRTTLWNNRPVGLAPLFLVVFQLVLGVVVALVVVSDKSR
jgi:hypothetical protein